MKPPTDNLVFREYLNGFKPVLKKELSGLITQRQELLKTEEPVFHEEINNQFYDLIAERFSQELAKNFDTDPEEILLFLQTFDIKEWLDG